MLNEFCFDAFGAIFGGNLSLEIMDFLKKITESMQGLFTKGGAAVVTLDIFLAVGVSLMTIFFFVDVLQKTSREMMSLDRLVLSFVKLMLAVAVLLYLKELVSAIMDMAFKMYKGFGNYISTKDKNTGDLGMTFWGNSTWPEFYKNDVIPPNYSHAGETYEQAFDSEFGGIIGDFGMACGLMIPYLLTYLSKLAAYFIAVTTSITLIVQTIFMPIAVAECFDDSGRNNAIRYIKKFAATALTFTIILGVVYATTLFQQAVSGKFGGSDNDITMENIKTKATGGGLIITIVIQLASVGGILKASSLANDIVN